MESKFNDAIIKEKVRRVSDAMSQEGMPLDEEAIRILTECFRGHMTFEQARLAIISKKRNGGLGGK